MPHSLDIVIFGLAITSSFGNGHATTWRALIRGLHERGHRVLFLERDQPWYAAHRDAPQLPYCETQLYANVGTLRERFTQRLRKADAVVVGSYVHEGRDVCQWVLEQARGVRAFYDIDTPVTLADLDRDRCEYLGLEQIAEFDLLLSFTGGPTLQRLERQFGAKRALPLYCSVDATGHSPRTSAREFALGYMGTYSTDRQPGLERLLNEPARALSAERFVVAGAQYPWQLHWPANVERLQHVAPDRHAAFYGTQRFTLNLTRASMRAAGYSPSVRLFEAAACGTPVISDEWPGLAEFFTPGTEILTARTAADVIAYLQNVNDCERRHIARAARERVLAEHTGSRRAAQLESYIESAQLRSTFGTAIEEMTPPLSSQISAIL